MQLSSFTINIFLVLLLLHYVQAFINLADVECGVSKIRSGKIVNGVNAAKAEFPWMVSLQLESHLCGGAVIHKNWVITAAHCVENREASKFQLTVGRHSLKDENSPEMTKFNVKEIIMHPSYAYGHIKGNIALIKINGNLEWSDYVQPVCLPDSVGSSFSGRIATVTGWGWSDGVKNGGHRYDTLQKVDLPILDNHVCQDWYKKEKTNVVVADSIICAGFEEGGKDACQGDSGGPLVIEQDGHKLVVGVVNKGIGCARPRLPGLYARVTSYIDWVLEHVQKQ